MPKEKQVNVRLADDMADDVVDYASKHNMSDAEVLRRFADRGRQEFGYAGGQTVTQLENVASQLFQIGFILGLAFLMLTFIAPLPYLFFGAAGAISVAAVAHIIVWAEPTITDHARENTTRTAEEPE